MKTIVCALLGAIAAGAAPPRAMWIWEAHRLLDEKSARDGAIRFSRERGVGEWFLQMSRKLLAERPADVRELLQAAREAGILIHALDGFPEAAMRPNHAQVLDFVRAVLEFNRSSPAPQRFHGIHFDNEPYLLLAFETHRETILRQFLELNESAAALVRQEPARPVLGADIPFWFDQNPDLVLEWKGARKDPAKHLLDMLDNVGVMDYRTEAGGPNGIVTHGRGEVQYAARVGKRVYIGVETGDLRPGPMRFLLGIPEARWRALGPSAPFLFASQIDGFRLSSVSDGVNRHVGTGEAAPLATLAKLREIYGSSGDRGKLMKQAAAAMARNREFQGFKPFHLKDGSGRRLDGFSAAPVPSPTTTFFGASREEMDRVLAQAASAFTGPGFWGFAIHDYNGYRALRAK